MNREVIIVGGGASGMVAAISAKRLGAKVTIIEKNQRLGKKILATGNGRCNYTNMGMTKNCYNHPFFVLPVFEQFSLNDTIEFFKDLGIYPRVEKEGKAYPTSLQSKSIVDALEREIHKLNIKVMKETSVLSINYTGTGYELQLSNNHVLKANKVVISTGGLALPKSGSSGDGYEFSLNFGHQLTDLFPALVKLNLDCPYLKETDGVKIETTVSLYEKDKFVMKKLNDVLFTKYGVSGPTILDLSRKANELLSKGRDVYISVNLVPDLEEKELEERFVRLKEMTVDEALLGLIHQKLITPILREANLTGDVKLKDLDRKGLEALFNKLYDYRFKVLSSKDFDEAQVTAGGINIKDVDKITLESQLMPGLYFTGEVLDIDGICGGYNLQWAWSSGYVAGMHAAND